MRSLSPEEAALWARVTASIRPLSRDAQKASPPPATAAESAPDGPPAARPAPKPGPRKPPATPQRPRPGTTLDRTWDRKLRGGEVRPDRIVDLHGLDLDRAWRAIDLELERAIGAGDRTILLITGHERPGEPPIARGKIRAAVHDWLGASRHAARIAAVRGAHRRHGGGGSLYIILRRP